MENDFDETEISPFFDKTSGPGSNLPLVDKQQAFVLYSVSHEKSPPVSDATNPALRVYGSFATSKGAAKFAEKIKSCDPTCCLFVAKTGEWVLACSSLNKYSQEGYIESTTKNMLKRHEVERNVSQEKFKQHREELRANTPIDESESRPVLQEPMEEKEEQQEQNNSAINNENDVDDEEDGMPVLSQDCKILDQNFMAISFVLEKAKRSDGSITTNHEFLFNVHRVLKSEEEADGFVRNVVSKSIIDHNVLVADVGAWLRPYTEIDNVKKHYRDSRLNDLMDRNGNENYEDLMEGCTKNQYAPDDTSGTLV